MNIDQNPILPAFILIALYVFFGYCLSRIAKKVGDERAWWAWVPVLQVLLMLRLAQLSLWWFIGLLVPFVNIAVGIYVWVRVANRLAKPWWMGVLMIVPGIDLFVLGYLAFAK
jgi:hypothetical protein